MIRKSIISFIGKVGLFMILVVFLDLIIGTTLHYFYFKQVAGAAYRTTYSMDSTKADILVFGSSRANHHYVPEVFEDSLKMSFYNTGKDGNRLLYNYAIYNSILKRHTPKLIILDIGFDELYYNPDEYNRLSTLLPYYKENSEIRNIVDKRSPFEKLKLLSSIYPYNSILLSIAIGTLELNKKRKADIKGYVSLKESNTNISFDELFIKEQPIDSFKVIALEAIAKTCYLKKIPLYIIQSPIYAKVKHTLSTDVCKQIAQKFNAKYFDFSEDMFFIEASGYFFDKSHLNDKGARVFSRRLLKKLEIQ